MPSPASSPAPQARTTEAEPTARLLSAARTPGWTTAHGRRVSACIRPDPGAHAGAPAWRNRAHWLAAVAADVARDPDGLTAHHVAGGTVLLVARAMAPYADALTGRDCRPTNERVMAGAQVSLATVKRARAWLRARGLLVELVRGKSILSRAERLQAWRAGSSHRQIASEFALTLPRRLAGVVHNPGPRPVRREPPPIDSEGEMVKSPDLRFFTGKNRDRRNGAARRANPKSPPGPRTTAQARHARLTAAVQRAVPWLAGVSPRRLTVLARFAAHGWTERDVVTALDDVLRARGWRVPDRVTTPAAYLATLLRDVDPADRPGALLEAMLADERERRTELATRAAMPECAHGVNAGDVPNRRGLIECPMCRAEARLIESTAGRG